MVRVLGPDRYGLINFAGALTAYFGVFIDFGFNLSATRHISIFRNDAKKLSEITSSIYFIKIILAAISFLILVIVLSFDIFKQDQHVFIFSWLYVIGNVLFPVWFFQGIENMKYLTILNISGKLLSTILIFTLIRDSLDYLLVVQIHSSSFMLTGITGILFLRLKFGVVFRRIRFNIIIYHLRESWHIFISTFTINTYSTTITFLLGLFTNNVVVGNFVAGDKIRLAFQSIISIISQSAFSHVSALSCRSKRETFMLIRKIFIISCSVGILISTGLYVFADMIIMILLGIGYSDSVDVLKILSYVIFFVSISSILGNQIMINFDMRKILALIIISSSILNLLLSVFIIKYFSATGASISILMVESGISLSMILYLMCNQKLQSYGTT